MAGIVEDTGYGQVCGQVISDSGQDASGYSVEINANSDGIYYFNNLGYIDRRLEETSENGKYCIFNVDVGQAVITATKQETSISQIASVASSYLSILDFFEENVSALVRYGISGSAYEQLSDMKEVENSIKVIDFAPVEMIEANSEAKYLETGAVVFDEIVRDQNGLVHLTVDAFELEPSVARVGGGYIEGDYIVPFYPRGFVEDLAVMNNVSYDSSMGQVIIEHGILNGEDGNTLKVNLYDNAGQIIGNVKYLDENPVLKAIYFDVPEGQYLAVVKDESGAWVSSSIVQVYDKRLSIVKSGRLQVLNSSYCDIECLSR